MLDEESTAAGGSLPQTRLLDREGWQVVCAVEPFSSATLISKVLIKQVVWREALVRNMCLGMCVSVLRQSHRIWAGGEEVDSLLLLPFGISYQDLEQACLCFWETLQVGQTQLS